MISSKHLIATRVFVQHAVDGDLLFILKKVSPNMFGRSRFGVHRNSFRLKSSCCWEKHTSTQVFIILISLFWRVYFCC